MSGRRWTKQELETVRRMYPAERWPALLSALPGRTKASIRCQVILLGIKRQKNSKVWWTGAERMLLSKVYPREPWPKICAAIPRHSQQAIARMAGVMKVGRDSARKQSRYRLIRELRKIRRNSGIPQSNLADIIGAHRVQLARWETGEQVPRLASFFDWVEALGFRLEIEKQRAA